MTPPLSESEIEELEEHLQHANPIYRARVLAAMRSSRCDGNHSAPACMDPQCWQRVDLGAIMEARRIADVVLRGGRLVRGEARTLAEGFRACDSQRAAFARAGAPVRGLVLAQLVEERKRQDDQWGGPAEDDDRDRTAWLRLVKDHSERAKKAVSKTGDLDEYRQQMLAVAALAVAAIEAHDRRSRG